MWCTRVHEGDCWSPALAVAAILHHSPLRFPRRVARLRRPSTRATRRLHLAVAAGVAANAATQRGRVSLGWVCVGGDREVLVNNVVIVIGIVIAKHTDVVSASCQRQPTQCGCSLASLVSKHTHCWRRPRVVTGAGSRTRASCVTGGRVLLRWRSCSSCIVRRPVHHAGSARV